MNAQQARRVLLVRAVEENRQSGDESVQSSASAAWTAADADWADAEALRRIGDGSTGERFLIERANLAIDRIAERNQADAKTWASLGRYPEGQGLSLILVFLLVLALLAGLATDALGPSRQVNLLAPPLLALMGWNIAVYVGLLAQAGWRFFQSPQTSTAHSQTVGYIERLASMLTRKWSLRRLPAGAPVEARRFADDWARAGRPLHAARLAGWLHLAALAVAAGALLALYARGLVFEFQAGWDSTFVGADFVHRWLSVLLAPAQAISSMALPDAAHIKSLRFANGGGENAARWIHWYAITTGLIMLPRLALAAAAMLHSRRLQRNFPLPLGDRYFQRLLQRQSRASGRTAQVVGVLPYGHRLAGDLESRLAAAVDNEWGPGLSLKILANTAVGDEDELADDWPRAAFGDADVRWLLPLFALSATPERETHGAFIRMLKTRLASMAGYPQWRVMIDESGFRERLAGADLERRVAERRLAWQKLLDELGAGPALSVDLASRRPTHP